MGQTTESFFSLLPRQADRATKIRLFVITEEFGIVADTEISLGDQRYENLLKLYDLTFSQNDWRK